MMVTGVNPPNAFGGASTAGDGIVVLGRPCEIRPIPGHGELATYLVGNPTAFLDLCTKKNLGAVATGAQITLVAGVCKQRDLTLQVSV